MEPTTWQSYAIMALVCALIGFAVGAFLEWVDDWHDKLRWLTAVLGGFFGAPLASSCFWTRGNMSAWS